MNAQEIEFKDQQGNDAIDEERTNLIGASMPAPIEPPGTLDDELVEVRDAILEDWERMEESLRYLADR